MALHDDIREPWLRDIAQGNARWSAVHANVNVENKQLAAAIYVGDQIARLVEAGERLADAVERLEMMT